MSRVGTFRLGQWAFLCGLAVLGILFLGAKPAQAAPYVPDAVNFTPAGSMGDPWLEVSKADGVNVQLQAPVLWLKVYSTTPNISIDFDNIGTCAPDFGPPVDTVFRVMRSTPRENLEQDISGIIVLASGSTGGVTGCGNVTLNVSGLVRSTVEGHTNFYVGLIQVYYNTPAGGSINRFKVWGDGNEVGYWDQGGVENTATGVITPINDAYSPTNPNANPLAFYGLGSAFALQSPSTQPSIAPPQGQDMVLEFAPSCDVVSNRTAYLKWFDADQGMPNQRGDVWYTLDEFDENGAYVTTQLNTNNVGTDGEFRAEAFTAVPNHRYRWTWHNVDQNNGIQFWMPYDSQNYYFLCDVPPIGLLNGAPQTNCDQVTGWVFDQDNWGVALRVRVYRDALPAFGGVLVDETIANGPGPGGLVPGPHTYVLDISGVKDYSRHNFWVTAFNINRAGAETGEEVLSLTNNPQAIGPCAAPPGCSVLSIVASDGTSLPEPADPFSTDVGFQFGGTPPSFSFNYTIATNFAGATNGVQTYNGTYPANGATHTFAGLQRTPAGVYTGNWTVTVVGTSATALANLPQTINCSGQYTVAAKPYIKAFGGDMRAGGVFESAGACGALGPSQVNASITGYDRATGGYSGASAQYAAFALGNIRSFFSAGKRNGAASAPLPPAGLNFGNTMNGATAIAGNIYGGRGGVPQCVNDYFSAASSVPLTPSATYSIPAGSTPPVRLQAAGPGRVTVQAPAGALSGSHVIYVDGDAVIRANGALNGILFAPYASVANMPSFYLIVRGNIYIDGDVTSLAGVYVAQPNGATGGEIFTCTRSNGDQYTPAELAASCNKQLTVNGAFVANKVRLLRSFGTLRQATPNEATPGSFAGEVFKFTPELYLATLDPILKTSTAQSYDSVTSLPPIL